MYMRIVWGKIRPGEWDGFEKAYKAAVDRRGKINGMKSQWLLRDEKDPDAGYSISLWTGADAMRDYAESKASKETLTTLQPFFVNQYTVTACEVRYSGGG